MPAWQRRAGNDWTRDAGAGVIQPRGAFCATWIDGFLRRACGVPCDSGREPYRAGLIRGNPYAARRQVIGSLVVVLDGYLSDRRLQLILPEARVFQRGTIHELLITDEPDAGPGGTVQRVSYLGFFEVQVGGVIRVGDRLIIDGREIAVIRGFDETHAPNHINVVSFRPQLAGSSGSDLGLMVEMQVTFVGPGIISPV